MSQAQCFFVYMHTQRIIARVIPLSSSIFKRSSLLRIIISKKNIVSKVSPTHPHTHTVYVTSGSPFFFVTPPSALWLSEAPREPTPSVLVWGSTVVVDGWEGACSWYNRFLSFSSKVLMVRSTNSTLRGPSLSDSPGPPLAGCCWLDDCEFWCAGLWGWEVIVPGCIGMAYGCCKTTDWWEVTWGGSSPVGLAFLLGILVWDETKPSAVPLLMAFTSRETGGTIAQHGMSVTIETAEIQGSSTGIELWWLTPVAASVFLVTHGWDCWTWDLPEYWDGVWTEVWAWAGIEEEEDGLWEDKDVAGIVTAAVLLLVLTDEADLSDSGETKRSESIRTSRRNCELNNQDQKECWGWAGSSECQSVTSLLIFLHQALLPFICAYSYCRTTYITGLNRWTTEMHTLMRRILSMHKTQ